MTTATTGAQASSDRSRSITVVGAGTVGAHLIEAIGRTSTHVRLAARNPESEKVRSVVDASGVEVVTLDAAVDGSDLIVLAVPFAAVADTVRALGDVGDAVLVDATNTVGSPLPDGASTIVEVIAGLAPQASIVKAFNTIGAEAYTTPSVDGTPLFLPIAGDRPAADEVRELASEIGFDAMVVGERDAVHLLENFAELWIHLAFRAGLGRGFGFARLMRADDDSTT